MTLPQPFALPSNFTPPTELHATTSPGNGYWFLCRGSNILIEWVDGRAKLPYNVDTEILGLSQYQLLGKLDGTSCIAAALPEEIDDFGSQQFEMQSLRKLHFVLRDDFFAMAARAVQIVAWNNTHQFCGRCATPTIQLPTERAKRCPKCHLRQYPRLSPAVIMLISKGDQLLLARAPRFRDGMYSVLAGFVEPGESLEETVAREVREEVGLEVKNIRYFGSQPWPFPNSLMIGFTAEYASGTITPEPTEIEDAAWFEKDALPPVPGELSIARKLIDWFIIKS